MGQGSVMGHWAQSSMLHALKIIKLVFITFQNPFNKRQETLLKIWLPTPSDFDRSSENNDRY
jgi:hypothetical protein